MCGESLTRVMLTAMTTLADPDTPFATLDRSKLERNVRRLASQLEALGVPLRLHVKTAKSVEVAAVVFGDATGPITVSTLAEAEQFAEAGYDDIVYPVGIVASKLPRVLALLERGVRLTVVLDSAEQARVVADASREAGVAIPVLIEIDCDGHRAGLKPDDPAVLEVARVVAGGAELRGVLTHAGGAYHVHGEAALRRAADEERDAVVHAAEVLRADGLPCPVVSVGSTPTACFATDLTGVTEVRAGTYVFMDVVMVGLGVCAPEEIAMSVVVEVIGHQSDKGWILTDGGWMATSADHGPDGYGLVADLAGTPIPGLTMTSANQEHGILTSTGGMPPELPVGTRLRILPHHACATASQHRAYQVVDGSQAIEATWPRSGGW
jgi:D-serine deaminase-like pyridoxal phosphate-dependent protein